MAVVAAAASSACAQLVLWISSIGTCNVNSPEQIQVRPFLECEGGSTLSSNFKSSEEQKPSRHTENKEDMIRIQKRRI